MLNCHLKAAFEKPIIRSGGINIIGEKIAKTLSSLTNYPSKDEINNAFEDLPDLIHVFITLDENSCLQRIT